VSRERVHHLQIHIHIHSLNLNTYALQSSGIRTKTEDAGGFANSGKAFSLPAPPSNKSEGSYSL
jgi:hypothetical protein